MNIKKATNLQKCQAHLQSVATTATITIRMSIEALVFGSVGVPKQRDADIDLFAPPLSDIRRQRRKSGVGVDNAITDVVAQRDGASNLGWGDRPIISHCTEQGTRREGRGYLILPKLGQQPLPP